MPWGTPRSYGRNIGARLVPTVGMTWSTPRSYGRNIDKGLECLGARLVPTVGTLTRGLNALGHASFLR